VGKTAATNQGGTRGLVAAYLGTQKDELRVNESGARIESPVAVHRMRVASRRLRSSLATFAPLFVGPQAHRLRDELLWLGAALGPVRDIEVTRDHLHGTAAIFRSTPIWPLRLLAWIVSWRNVIHAPTTTSSRPSTAPGVVI
jgi:inorganic triphosphatase YgiF